MILFFSVVLHNYFISNSVAGPSKNNSGLMHGHCTSILLSSKLDCFCHSCVDLIQCIDLLACGSNLQCIRVSTKCIQKLVQYLGL